MKYPKLFALVCCLSHGNSSLERGFSLNKQFIDSHVTSIQDNTITGCIQ